MVIRRLSLILLGLFPIILWAQIPEGAKKYAPMLKEEIEHKWSNFEDRAALAGQVEQETCVSLKSKRCWSPKAELKTPREHGIGFGQATITYNSDGSIKNDSVASIRSLDKDLAGWKGEGIWDPRYQLRGLVVYDKSIYNKLPKEIIDKLSFMFASYNGGLGGTLQDRRLCANTTSCDPNLWFGNVEKTSFKNKIKTKGYGKSFFEINREYPYNILKVRKFKYTKIME